MKGRAFIMLGDCMLVAHTAHKFFRARMTLDTCGFLIIARIFCPRWNCVTNGYLARESDIKSKCVIIQKKFQKQTGIIRSLHSAYR